MIWLDVALKTWVVASSIIATLRAGSRLVHLAGHDGIGIMNGPIIENTNETYPLFELSEAFRHCVRLSMTPEYYENVQTKMPIKMVVDPYPLSPRPYLPITANDYPLDDDTETEDEDSLPTTTMTRPASNNKSFWMRQMDATTNVLSSLSSSIQYTRTFLSLTPQYISYWSSRAWNWQFRKGAEEEATDTEDDEDWDWNSSTEGELRFNATTTSTDGTEQTTTRVAELSVFAPNTFQQLRNSIFGISEADYRRSIFGVGPFVSFQSNSKGAARVGGVFFFTRDGAYMIKTIKKEEAKTFLKMLPKYHKHMKRHGRKSLLTRFCGMYAVRIYNEGSSDRGDLHTFVVMNAVFPAEASGFISERFDLKGSTVGREVSEEELQKKGRDAVMKDMDLAREVQLVKSMNNNGRKTLEYGLSIGPLAKSALLSQLREDVKLLVDCQVMDYSLLVGVVDMQGFLPVDRATRKVMKSIQDVELKFQTSKKVEERALWAMGAPVRLLCAPPAYLVKQTWQIAQRTLGTIVTHPLPYYGAGKCGVDGGLLSVFHGTRHGRPALYYMGLIDFLQPWTARKVAERKLKGLMGYDVRAISCVSPEEYADRFLDYLNAHLS